MSRTPPLVSVFLFRWWAVDVHVHTQVGHPCSPRKACPWIVPGAGETIQNHLALSLGLLPSGRLLLARMWLLTTGVCPGKGAAHNYWCTNMHMTRCAPTHSGIHILFLLDVHVHSCTHVNHHGKIIYGDLLKNQKSQLWRYPNVSVPLGNQNR